MNREILNRTNDLIIDITNLKLTQIKFSIHRTLDLGDFIYDLQSLEKDKIKTLGVEDKFDNLIKSYNCDMFKLLNEGIQSISIQIDDVCELKLHLSGNKDVIYQLRPNDADIYTSCDWFKIVNSVKITTNKVPDELLDNVKNLIGTVSTILSSELKHINKVLTLRYSNTVDRGIVEFTNSGDIKIDEQQNKAIDYISEFLIIDRKDLLESISEINIDLRSKGDFNNRSTTPSSVKFILTNNSKVEYIYVANQLVLKRDYIEELTESLSNFEKENIKKNKINTYNQVNRLHSTIIKFFLLNTISNGRDKISLALECYFDSILANKCTKESLRHIAQKIDCKLKTILYGDNATIVTKYGKHIAITYVKLGELFPSGDIQTDDGKEIYGYNEIKALLNNLYGFNVDTNDLNLSNSIHIQESFNRLSEEGCCSSL